jgi:hypothetical protein
MLFDWYEGGQEDEKNRHDDKYGDDKKNFNVRGASGKNMEKGINPDRSCTDILCLLIWFAFLGSVIALVVYGKT